VSPVRYELVLYIPEAGILHSDRRKHLKSDMSFVVREVVTVLAINSKHISMVVIGSITLLSSGSNDKTSA
jgi:hypothetical protein